MAYSLDLPPPWNDRGWKVKIQDRERTEEPHVTIIQRRFKWRLSLRTGRFLDSDPDPKDVPKDLADEVLRCREELVTEWDEMYPLNPIESQEPDDDDE